MISGSPIFRLECEEKLEKRLLLIILEPPFLLHFLRIDGHDVFILRQFSQKFLMSLQHMPSCEVSMERKTAKPVIFVGHKDAVHFGILAGNHAIHFF